MIDRESKSRSRPLSALLVGLTIILGLASRKFSFLLPLWMAKNAGDVLYAVMAFWLAGFVFPRLSISRAALAAGGFCLGIELLKFVQIPWLAADRHSRAGALVFGSGFHWSNLLCYTIGVLAALLIERTLLLPQVPAPARRRH